MIKSMTGYGRSSQIIDGMEITVEIKTVNHRYFEFGVRMPRMYNFCEDKIKSAVGSRISRGKAEVFITVKATTADNTSISINHSLASAYKNAIDEISNKYELKNNLTPTEIARFPEVLSVSKEEDNEEFISNAFITMVNAAVDELVKMREYEGERLLTDIKAKTKTLSSLLENIEKSVPLSIDSYQEKLKQKICDMLSDSSISEAFLRPKVPLAGAPQWCDQNEARLLTEVAIFADRIAIDEEVVRFKSHISQLSEMLDLNEPVGRKLDFLIQELGREINTIGSKSAHIDITKTVVELKSELEKIREQVQNIE